MILLDQIAFGPARKPYQIVVVNPDLQVRGGGSHPDTEIRGNLSLKKNFIEPLRPQFGLKIIREAGGGGALPWIHHQIQPLFTHKNGAFGVISVTEQSCAVLCQSLK